MKDAVVVGQSTTDKCFVAKFNGTTETWTIDSSFPDVVGILRCCFSTTLGDIWVAGGTGVAGTTAPILYQYTTASGWVDHTADITDATFLTRMWGDASDNVQVMGVAPDNGSTTSGLWTYNGSWTSTRINTIGVGNYHHCLYDGYTGWRWGSTSSSVVVNGASYLPGDAVNGTITGVCELDNIVYTSQHSTGLAYYNNLTTGIGYNFLLLGADSYTGKCENIGTKVAYLRSHPSFDNPTGNLIIGIGNGIGGFSGDEYANTWGGINIYGMRGDREDNIWLCGATGPAWDASNAVLVYFSDATKTFSTSTDFGVDTLGAYQWYDVSVSLDIPPTAPYLISEPISTNPGYYIDTPMTWKIGQD